MSAEIKKYKYPFADLVKSLRDTKPRFPSTDADNMALARYLQWEHDVRAVARAINESSLTNFDPERFCHSIGLQFNPRAPRLRGSNGN